MTLEGIDGAKFKGFVIQALDAQKHDFQNIGYFKNGKLDMYTDNKCSFIMSTTRESRDSVTVSWTTNQKTPGKVRFM